MRLFVHRCKQLFPLARKLPVDRTRQRARAQTERSIVFDNSVPPLHLSLQQTVKSQYHLTRTLQLLIDRERVSGLY